MTDNIHRRGFASMTLEKRRELAALGGKKSRRGPGRSKGTIGDTLGMRANTNTKTNTLK